MNLDRIKRGVFFFIIIVLSSMAGFFVKRALIEGGVFQMSTMEIISTCITGALVAILIPIIELRKKNRG